MDTQDPSKNVPACCRCNWWSFLNSVAGQCRRMPPAAHFEDGHYWPITGRADWCGEFKTTFAASVEADGRSDEPANAPHERAAEGRPLDAVVGRHYTGDDK